MYDVLSWSEISRSAAEGNLYKLVTIALYGDYQGGDPLSHGKVEEHLSDLLQQGWCVVSVTPVGTGGGEAAAFAGWLAVVLKGNSQ